VTREEGDPLKIAVALFEGAEELDWAGPWEIFAAWAEHWPQDDVEVFTVGEDDRPIRCAKGLRVLADRTWPADGPIDVDVLLYPGGRGTLRQLGDDAIRARVRGLAEAGTLMTSVCTGSLVYADAGLLDGRPATTHWDSIHLLGPLGNAIDVRDEERFVDAGPVVTAAGVTAGIDMALHLVGRLHSVERGRDLRRYIQYDPAPPL
jgi:transcriptional regulator GlxA family with amidase domain